jgi:hypothetical protein
VEQSCSDYRCATNYLVGADEIWQAVSQSGPQKFANIKEMVMGKVIEFYVPAISHKPLKGASEQQRAKVIEFCTQTPVDSFACAEVHGNWTSALGVACPSRDPQTASRNLEATGTAFRGRATDSEGFGRPSRLSRSWIGKEHSVRHRQASSHDRDAARPVGCATTGTGWTNRRGPHPFLHSFIPDNLLLPFNDVCYRQQTASDEMANTDQKGPLRHRATGIQF